MISIIIPVIRPDKAERCIKAILDDDFTGWIVAEEDKDRIGCPKMVKRLAEKASGDLICFIGDDTIPRPGWLDAGIEKMNCLPDGWGVVGLKTEGSVKCAHWLADRRMLALTGGEFFSTEYKHFFCDNELMDIARENGRWAETDEIVINHDHPVNGRGDEKHISITDQVFKDDRKIYVKRKRERVGGLAIGFPLVDPDVPIQFFTSYVCMRKPDHTMLFPMFPHGPWSGSIADARNSLVQQAQNEGAEYLLMLDTDQIYPPDTLEKLLSHKVDICGVSVHRRYPPFDRIFFRGNVEKLEHVREDEMYSGELIEIDATGTGCLLIDMSVFDDIEYPYFEFSHTKTGKPIGEDINFCHKARAAGRRVFVDTSIKVGHLAVIEIDEKMHRMCKLLMQKQEKENG